jgi:hypothetical protein
MPFVFVLLAARRKQTPSILSLNLMQKPGARQSGMIGRGDEFDG